MIYAIKEDYREMFVVLDSAMTVEQGYRLAANYEEYDKGDCFLLLNKEQEAFYTEHPTASVKEVWDMALTPAPITDELADAKAMKIYEIERHDTSSEVNSFNISGQTMWLSREDRAALFNRCAAEVAADKTETTVWTNTTPPFAITLNIEAARKMLLQIEHYAAQCFDATQAHKAAVASLNTIEEVQKYDYRVGYPIQIKLQSNLTE